MLEFPSEFIRHHWSITCPFIVKYSRHCLETLFQIEYGITYEEIEDLQKIYSLLNAQGSAHVLHTISNYLITGYVTL